MYKKLKKIKLLKKFFSKVKKQEDEKENNIWKLFFVHIIVVGLISLVFLPLIYIDSLNPVYKTLKDITFSDLYFSKIRAGSDADTASSQIFIVDIGQKDKLKTRQEITEFLTILQLEENRPRAIGFDVLFEDNVDEFIDQKLANALRQENIVLLSGLTKAGSKQQFIPYGSSFKFSNYVETGFGNQFLENTNNLTERYYVPEHQWEEYGENLQIEHFATTVAKKYSLSKYNKYKLDNKLKTKQLINFRGDYKLHRIDISDTNNLKNLKDKIVLFGLYTFQNNEPVYNEDLHWTSRNNTLIGRSAPDMYGVEVHAQIISNIIHDDYIVNYPNLSLYVQIIICLSIYFFLLYLYTKNQLIFNTIKIILQSAFSLLFIVLSLFQIYFFNLYLDYSLVVFVSFFSAEMVGFINVISNRLINNYSKFQLNENIQSDNNSIS